MQQGGCSQNLPFSPRTGVSLLPRSNCSFWNVFIHHAGKSTNMQHNAKVCTLPGEFVLIPAFQNGGSRRFSLWNHNTPFNRCYFYLLQDQVTLIKAFIECLGMCGMARLSAESRNELTRGQYFQMFNVQLLLKVNIQAIFIILSHFYTWVFGDIEAFKTFLKPLADAPCLDQNSFSSNQNQFEDFFLWSFPVHLAYLMIRT